MQRVCEPELMDEEQQALAYAQADFAATDQALVEAIVELMRQQAAPLRNLVDLGCGPGNLSFRLATALPALPVLALDGAAAMLAHAERRQRSQPQSWPRLQFIQACLPLEPGSLGTLEREFQPPFSVLVSNSLLHHLHDPLVLWRSLQELGEPGSLVLIRDLRRPDGPGEMEALVSRHVSDCDPILQRDYRASLQAAFRPEEVRDQLQQCGLRGLRVEAVEDRYLEVVGQLD